MDELIKLTQHPVIMHKVAEMGKKVTERLTALNLENQLATEDTIKTLKALRAELNKESAAFEEQKKALKDAILSPFNDFESLYKVEINEKYKVADETLKSKINAFELAVKGEKRRKLLTYFEELSESTKINFIPFDKVIPEVNLSTPEKKYQAQIDEYFARTETDIRLIRTEEFADEIMVEYKKTLNQPQATLSVRERKEQQRIEEENRINMRSTERISQLIERDFVFNQFSDTYNFRCDENILIRTEDIKSINDREWAARLRNIDAVINDILRTETDKPEILQAPLIIANPNIPTLKQEDAPTSTTETTLDLFDNPLWPDQPEQTNQPDQPEDEICQSRFVVTDTFARLKQLKAFLIDNNYNYQNI